MARRIIAAISALILPLVLAIGGLVQFVVPDLVALGRPEPENTATCFPVDVTAYGWFTLNPGSGQRLQMLDTWERFNEMAGFDHAGDDWLIEITDKMGIDLEEQILPWAGPVVSAGIVDVVDSKVPDIALMVGVRNREAADEFLDDWRG